MKGVLYLVVDSDVTYGSGGKLVYEVRRSHMSHARMHEIQAPLAARARASAVLVAMPPLAHSMQSSLRFLLNSVLILSFFTLARAI
eukprot:1202733-Pleurochrysis_carterae.AAC.1